MLMPQLNFLRRQSQSRLVARLLSGRAQHHKKGYRDRDCQCTAGILSLAGLMVSNPALLYHLGVAGSMKSDPTYLIPEEIFLVDNNTRSAQPANTTFQSPGDLPAVTYKTQIGTPFLRVDVIPVFDTADEVATYLEDGIAIAGNIFSYEFSPVWNWFDVWNGTVAYRD